MNRLAPLLLAVLLGGCAYRLGPVGPAARRSVAVPMFQNQTLQPQIETRVTNAILKRLQTDGAARVGWEADADIVVRGTILRYDRSVVRGQKDDSVVPREYRLRIEARVEARDRLTGDVVVPATVLTGQADAFIGTDLQSAEQQALPLLAEDLARQVVSLLVERW